MRVPGTSADVGRLKQVTTGSLFRPLAGALAAAIALTTASALSGQDADWRAGRAARAGNVEDAELALDIMARCMVARHPELVRQWMDSLPGTFDERKLFIRYRDDLSNCLENNELYMGRLEVRFRAPMLRRPVALAVVRQRITETPAAAPASPEAEPWFVARMTGVSPESGLDRRSLLLQDFGHCVVLRAWPDSRALFAAPVDSPEEAAVFQRLTPALSPCLSEGTTIDITRRNLRLILARAVLSSAGSGSRRCCTATLTLAILNRLAKSHPPRCW